MGKAGEPSLAVNGDGTGCNCATPQAPCAPKRDRPTSDMGCATRSHRSLTPHRNASSRRGQSHATQ
jgi:hypothetical protein